MKSQGIDTASHTSRNAQLFIASAALLARAGEVDAAMESMGAAIAAGCCYESWWKEDPDLGILVSDPRFEALISKEDA